MHIPSPSSIVPPGTPLEPEYDFIVCGSGSAGSVVARRLSDDPAVRVLLIEAGDDDHSDAVTVALRWPENLGSARSWAYRSAPSPHLNGRTMQVDAGKALGGGSSINAMTWAHGHDSDWDFFASESGDAAWGSQSVRGLYQRIENRHGATLSTTTGSPGPLYVEPAHRPNALAYAFLDAASCVGLPVFPTHNGAMMTGNGGASLVESTIRDGQRQSVFRSYLGPVLDRPNLTIAIRTLVERVVFAGDQTRGVVVVQSGLRTEVRARAEVILCLGAIQTPKVLMQSGIGDKVQLEALGIGVVSHSPEVGQGYQDHVAIDVVWASPAPVVPRNSMSEALLFAPSSPALAVPDMQAVLVEMPLASEENAQLFNLPSSGWGLFGGNVRPRSRGWLQLSGARPEDPIRIHGNELSHPGDLDVAIASVELFRSIGNAAPFAPFRTREVMPGPLSGKALEGYVRNAARTFYHQSCTARMGRDEGAVVDGALQVRGVRGLRIADASIMPRITTGNTMAPTVIIGERASDLLNATHGLSGPPNAR